MCLQNGICLCVCCAYLCVGKSDSWLSLIYVNSKQIKGKSIEELDSVLSHRTQNHTNCFDSLVAVHTGSQAAWISSKVKLLPP